MKRIWHVGAWSNNYGDRVLQKAGRDILESIDDNLKFTYIDTQKTYFSKNLIEKMNKEADLLLVGGGGLIFHRPMDKSNSGWQLNIKEEDIDNINVPVAVWAIGYNKFPGAELECEEKMWRNLEKIASISSIFSVRNRGTYDSLKFKESLSKYNTEITPDPGMFVKNDLIGHRIFENNKLKIGINWATDRTEQRFSSFNVGKNTMAEFFVGVKRLAEKVDAEVYLIEHLMPNELTLIKDDMRNMFTDIIGGKIVYNELREELFPPFDYNAGMFADIYKKMDLVFGMRGHANIVPFGQNTAFIGIGRHDKVKWFLDSVGCGDLFISLDANVKDSVIEKGSHVIDNLKTIEKTIENELSVKRKEVLDICHRIIATAL